MAALIESAPRAPTPEIYDLRTINPAELDPLLVEETGVWREALDWDFEKSADLVRRFVELHALSGSALVENGRVVGYSYFVFEEHKGLIGDLYVTERFRTPDTESRLLETVLNGLMVTQNVRRVESQLMMSGATLPDPLPAEDYLSLYEREFMLLDITRRTLKPSGRGIGRITIDHWADHHQEASAKLIEVAYKGHIDAQINDQYRSLSGARRFLYNIVQYPGCGTFFGPASLVAFEQDTGEACGVSLTSMVGPHSGHITQICVAPQLKGAGLGYELLRQSLDLLRKQGCRSVSLTVTSSNEEAIRLYRRVGFKSIRRFFAYVWEGF